jgi:hypothetical protein
MLPIPAEVRVDFAVIPAHSADTVNQPCEGTYAKEKNY